VNHAKSIVEFLARALADEPEFVRVTEAQHQEMTVLELFVAPGDLGRMIGRQGRTAAAFRTLVAAAAEQDGQRVTLEIREGNAR
jgi:predicted RNA-binding protein YlqC (UPF0109 family)